MDMLPDTCVEQAPAPLQIVASRSLFREPTKRQHLTRPAGPTLLEVAIEAGMAELRDDDLVHLPGKVEITIDGHVVPREVWHQVRPKAGRLINITLVPQNQRQAILVGASLAIAVAAIATGGILAAPGGALAAAIGAGGAAAVGAGAAAAISIGGNYDLTSFPGDGR